MKIMDFSRCEFLKEIRDVSKIPNLEELTLDGCTNLVEIHDSVGFLDKLVSLSLKNCYNLSSFPTSLKLRSLKFFNLDGCSRINHFPEIECKMEFLKCIYVGRTGIKELPSSIQYLIGLEKLCLEDCINLTNLPGNIYQLQHLGILNLNGCSKLVKFPEKMGDSGQSMLPPTNSSVFNDGCSLIVFPALRELNLSNCVLLESEFFGIRNCSTPEQHYSDARRNGSCSPCIKSVLILDDCDQIQKIKAFPPNSARVDTYHRNLSLGLYNKLWLPNFLTKFQSTEIMDFSKCKFLKIIPDVSEIPNLEKLTLDGCTNLVEIHNSVGSLDKLVELSLINCHNLSSFPTSLKLRSLEYLNLDGCSMINHFPEIECEMKYIKSIYFRGTGIKNLPSSIRYLVGLEELMLARCINLTNIPSSIYELQHLNNLNVRGCSKLVKLPAPGPVGSGIELEEHLVSRSFDFEVTGNNIPDWFSYRKEVSNSNSCEIDIDVPADLDGEITAIAFSAVLETEYDNFASIWVDVIRGGVGIYYSCLTFESDCVWLHFHVPESFKRKEYNGHLRVKFVCKRGYGDC